MLGDTPVGHGFLEGTLGASTVAGPFARVEAGFRPLERLAAFAFGQADQGGAGAGLGLRLTF